MGASRQEFEEKISVLAFRRSASGTEEPVETSMAAMRSQGYETVDAYTKAQGLRLATREEVARHFGDNTPPEWEFGGEPMALKPWPKPREPA